VARYSISEQLRFDLDAFVGDPLRESLRLADKGFQPSPEFLPTTMDEWHSQSRAAVSRISFEIPFHFRRGQPQCPHQRCLPIEPARQRRRSPPHAGVACEIFGESRPLRIWDRDRQRRPQLLKAAHLLVNSSFCGLSEARIEIAASETHVS
jgi:hypothetical protein